MDSLGHLEASNAEQDDEQEELALCKICFAEGSNDSPLLHGVCDCKGSLDGVHGRCLVKWQLKRTSKPWHCEICDSKVQWPATETLKLVELLSELSEKKTPPPLPTRPQRSQRQIALAARVERRQNSRHQGMNGPSKWSVMKQAMSTKCLLAARSFRTVGKSIFLPGTSRQRGSSNSSSSAGPE